MQIEIELPSNNTFRTDLDEQYTADALLQELTGAGHLDREQVYRLTLVISPHTRLERLVGLGENIFSVERKIYHESGSVTKAEPGKTGLRKVFVVHGRNHAARNAAFEFLRALGLDPIEWTEAISLSGKAAPYIGEILDAGLSAAQAVVVLLTGDDEVRLNNEESDNGSHNNSFMPQARPNVIFEAGMALAKYPNRTILVELGSTNIFSDISGRHTVRLNNSPEARHALAIRLQNAGCDVNFQRADWYNSGDFDF